MLFIASLLLPSLTTLIPLMSSLVPYSFCLSYLYSLIRTFFIFNSSSFVHYSPILSCFLLAYLYLPSLTTLIHFISFLFLYSSCLFYLFSFFCFYHVSSLVLCSPILHALLTSLILLSLTLLIPPHVIPRFLLILSVLFVFLFESFVFYNFSSFGLCSPILHDLLASLILPSLVPLIPLMSFLVPYSFCLSYFFSLSPTFFLSFLFLFAFLSYSSCLASSLLSSLTGSPHSPHLIPRSVLTLHLLSPKLSILSELCSSFPLSLQETRGRTMIAE